MYLYINGEKRRADEFTPKERKIMKLNSSKPIKSGLDKAVSSLYATGSTEERREFSEKAVLLLIEVEQVLSAHSEAVFMINTFNKTIQLSLRLNKKAEWENQQALTLLELIEKVTEQ